MEWIDRKTIHFFLGCFLRYHFSKAFLFFHDSWISFKVTSLSLIIKRSFYSADPFSLNDVFYPPNCCHKIANVYVFSSSKHYRRLVKVNVDCHSITRLMIQPCRQQYQTFCEKWKKNSHNHNNKNNNKFRPENLLASNFLRGYVAEEKFACKIID